MKTVKGDKKKVSEIKKKVREKKEQTQLFMLRNPKIKSR